MKIAVVYTAKSDALEKNINDAIKERFGKETEITVYQDLSVLQETVKAGHITKEAAGRYTGLCLQAVTDKADAVLSTCCVMGDAVEPLKPFMKYESVPVVSIDESFCRRALAENEHLILLATAPDAAESVGNTLKRYERTMGRFPKVDVVIAKNAAGTVGDEFAEKLYEAVSSYDLDNTGVIFSQPSMAFSTSVIKGKTNCRIYTAVDDPAVDLANVLRENGKVQ